MKKLLLSVAVIAASGAYVAYQDHGGAKPLGLAATDMPLAGQLVPVAPQPKAALSPTSDPGPAPAPVAPESAAAQPPGPQAAATTAASPFDAADRRPERGATIAYFPASQTPPTTPARVQGEPAASGVSTGAVPLPLPRPLDAPRPDGRAAIGPAGDTFAAQEVSTQALAQAETGYRNGSYKGVSANAYYGRVQVEAVVSNGRLAAIRMLDYPRDRRRSLYIAQHSLPVLEQEAISAQSARIDAVSGATLTSKAFMKSLDSALSSARAGGGSA